VRSKKVEVRPPDDPCFREMPHVRLQNEVCPRVFLPLVTSTDRVLGVVEAGHLSRYPPHIYGNDVKILEGFVDYAAVALQQWRRGLLDRISHDLRSPILGIREEANAIKRMVEKVGQPTTADLLHVCNTLHRNCESLFCQVVQLDYLLSKPLRRFQFQSGKSLPCDIKEVIEDHIRWLTPLFKFIVAKKESLAEDDLTRGGGSHREFGQAVGQAGSPPPIRIALHPDRMVLPYLNREVLNHVCYNLLMNSINYAKEDPRQFQIEIDDSETGSHVVIHFKDWGMGIPKGFEQKIFESGFRTEEAKRRVNGTGLGLSIAREVLRDIGGDLVLTNICEPTTFSIQLPKKPKEVQQ